MRPSLLPRMVNSPLHDPALFVQFLFENKAILFDLGEIYTLSTRDILKLSMVFVSHTHMDHFSGFDRLLRLFLGRDKQLTLYGPRGFLRNVEGKLAGYQWNLVDNFTNNFSLQAVEILPETTRTRTYVCRQQFQSSRDAVVCPFSNPIVALPSFSVFVEILDHRIPCLAFSIKEQFHINIKTDALKRLGLQPGPWLNRFKQAIFQQLPGDTELQIPAGNGSKHHTLGSLTEKIALITPGQKITYVTDVGYSRENVEKIVSFAQNSDHLFMEAAFLDKHADIAADKCHLTARQAGDLAALAQAKRFTPFHFSPRYTDNPQDVIDEAMKAYEEGMRGE